MSTENPYYVNFNADNAQCYLRRFRWVDSEKGGDAALACDAFVEYGKPRTNGEFKGKRRTSACSVYFKGQTAVGRALELIDAFGMKELGKTVKLSTIVSLGDLRGDVWFGETNGKPDINQAHPIIAATLYRLDSASYKDKEGKWTEFHFVTQPPVQEQVDGEIVESPASPDTVTVTHQALPAPWLKDLIDQAESNQNTIPFANDHEGFAAANAALNQRGYLYFDAGSLFVKKQQTRSPSKAA